MRLRKKVKGNKTIWYAARTNKPITWNGLVVLKKVVRPLYYNDKWKVKWFGKYPGTIRYTKKKDAMEMVKHQVKKLFNKEKRFARK